MYIITEVMYSVRAWGWNSQSRRNIIYNYGEVGQGKEEHKD